MFKVNNRNTRKKCEIKTIKTFVLLFSIENCEFFERGIIWIMHKYLNIEKYPLYTQFNRKLYKITNLLELYYITNVFNKFPRTFRTTTVFIYFSQERSEVFCKNGAPKYFATFTEKHLCQSLLFNKAAGLRPATLLKKRLWHWVFMNSRNI